MRCTVKNPKELFYRDTARYEFTPQKYVDGEWETAIPSLTEAFLEAESREKLQELDVISVGTNFAVDFYADDSIFDEEPDEQIIEPNKVFYITFYWEYNVGGKVYEKSEPFFIKVI